MAQIMIDIIGILAGFVSLFYLNRSIYTLVGLFSTRKFFPAKHQHRYAVLVAARNEAAVIGNLIESIAMQDYPRELVDVFVVADNCTDDTARVATAAGAVCYERFDSQHRTKGYALQFLVERIRRDYGISHYDGYFVFDADNLLKRDYISRMNDAFDAGEKIVTSYRSSKNFDANWISASYSIHWLRTARMENRARALLRSATRVQGTGFLFSWELIRDGWKYTSLTEDRAFCADAVVQGYRISYNDDAIFYDEQPESLPIALRQRLRWAKGHLLSAVESGPKLFVNMFLCKKDPSRTGQGSGFLERLHRRYLSADMLSVVYPKSLMALVRRIVIYLLRITMVFSVGHTVISAQMASESVRYALEMFSLRDLPKTASEAIFLLTLMGLISSVMSLGTRIFQAAFIMVIEGKRMIPMPWYKKAWFCFTFPLFDVIGKFSSLIALFVPIEWKEIPHKAAVRIRDLEKIQEK